MKLIRLLSSALFFFMLCSYSSFSISDNTLTENSGVDSLLREARSAKEKSDSLNAALFSPIAYGKGHKLLKSAQDKQTRKKSTASITRSLSLALEQFDRANKTTQTALKLFDNAIQARNDAQAAEAGKYAPSEWATAEKNFNVAIKRLETGKIDTAKLKSSAAQTAYRSAELAAIKNNYLAGARRLIAKAEKEKVKKYAPLTLADARKLLAQAEKELNVNRYDTDKARSLARKAKVQAGHSLYLTNAFKSIREGKTNLEQFALQSEQPLEKIATSLDMNIDLDNGLNKPTENMVNVIHQLRADAVSLNLLEQEFTVLESENRQLNKKLGIQSSRLRHQEAIKQKISLVEAMFAFKEALVYRQSGNVLIRMVGLNFESGQAVIQSENFNLLRKVIDALLLFPNAALTIEGHTDSFGSDKTNLELSNQRANAVLAYLKSNMDNKHLEQMYALGYGEAKPVANNETAEGRRKNRRIDLVIKPKF